MLYFVLLAVLCCVAAIDCDVQSGHDVIAVQNIAEFLQQNPNAKLMERLDDDDDDDTDEDDDDDDLDNVFRYRLGQRESGGGDQLVASNSSTQTFPSPQDFSLSLSFPVTGTEPVTVMTLVEIKVWQSSNLGQAYVTDGGIGENRITVVVEAQNTTIFRHRARIFGIID